MPDITFAAQDLYTPSVNPSIRRSLTIVLVALFAAMARGQGAPPEGTTPPVPVSRESVEKKISTLSESETVAANLYQEVLAQLDAAATAKDRADTARRQTGEAPGLLASIREELARPAAIPMPEVPENATLVQLEQGQSQATAQLSSARQLLTDLQRETATRQDRRTQIPEARASEQRRLLELDDKLGVSPPEPEPTPEAEARRMLLLAQRQAVAAEIDALDAELASYDARQELFPARRDRAARRVAEAEALISAWQSKVGERRDQEATLAAENAKALQRQAARQHPALQAYAAVSQRLAEERTGPDGIPAKITTAAQDAALDRSRLTELSQQYISVRRRIEASGLNRATGLLLRRQYETMPDTEEIQRKVKRNQRELEETEYTKIEREEERDAAGDTDRVVQGLLAEFDGKEEARDQFETVARELAAARRDLLGELVSDSTRYFQTLLELDEVSRELLMAARNYELYVSERILWVKSISSNQWPATDDIGSAVQWFVSPESWKQTGRNIRDDMATRFPTTLFAVLGLVIAFIMQRKCCARIRELGDRVSRYRTDAFSHTFRVILLTLLASVPMPALLLWLGWVLSRPPEQNELGVMLGEGFLAGGLLLLPMAFLRQMIRRRGLADVHFRWPTASLQAIRTHLRWLIPIVIPAVVIVITLDRLGQESFSGSLGRVVFTVGMLSFAVFIQRVLRPSGPVMGEFFRRNQGGWADRLRYLWFPSLVGVPLTLVIGAWFGYFYTAMQLEARLENTLAFVLLLVLANGVLMRWLFVARRRVAIEDAKRRRSQAAAEAKAGGTDEDNVAEVASVPVVDEDKLDLPAISLQTRALFRIAILVAAVVGLFAIWADVLPALRMLDRVEVYPHLRVSSTHEDSSVPRWNTGVTVSPRPTGEAGASAPSNGNGSFSTPAILTERADETVSESGASGVDEHSVTLADLGFAIVVLVTTMILFRNLPGLIEIVILQRLPLDAGSRYALSTVLRYTIAIIGIAIAFGAVGLSWSRVQWLAAALTFGLAFGLQEIFANFISGLIILGERPVRIGDTVTVGGVTGTVTRIRMRATTIADWDRKELIIPNKGFITGEVINWSLSDPILRVKIPVGVSYSADVRKTERILLQIAAQQPTVLKDPEPTVVFSNFGDSTLDFELRVFIPNIDQFVPVQHDLHMRIIEAFRENGIEIAFPQRDLHVRSIGDLAGLVQKRSDLGDGGSPKPA
ncbi:MAG: potassium efflux system protein [Phycisphaerales bacterium]